MRFFDFFFANPTPPPEPEPQYVEDDVAPLEAPLEDMPPPEAQTPDLHPDPIIRGQRAENLLNDPMLRAAFESARNKYRREWESAAIDQLDQQRHAHIKFTVLKDVLREINQHITNAGFIRAKNQAEMKRETAKMRASTGGAADSSDTLWSQHLMGPTLS